jgi:GNAT superfamily N-acetyltransferase
VSIRPAGADDGAELARLRWAFRPEARATQDLREFVRDFEEWLGPALASDWMAAVADTGDGTLVGCIFLRSVNKVPNPGARDRAWGYVTNSYVEPGFRGSGIGARLLDCVVSAAREKGHELLIVWPSQEAVTLYTRAGFEDVGRAHAGPGDHPPLELMLG